MNSHSYRSRGLVRYLLISLGCICIFLAIVGIFLPLLPTTVFVLIAAWSFAQSSERFHHWLINHPKLGPIVRNWRSKNGINRSIRNRAIVTLWSTMVISMLLIGKLWVVLLLVGIGSGVSIYLLRLPLLENLSCPVREGNPSSPQQQ
jgi:uncharacterized protein